MGEDWDQEMEGFESICDFCESHLEGSEGDMRRGPMVSISSETYHSFFQPWRGALILKLFGKMINLRVMEQRTRDL